MFGYMSIRDFENKKNQILSEEEILFEKDKAVNYKSFRMSFLQILPLIFIILLYLISNWNSPALGFFRYLWPILLILIFFLFSFIFESNSKIIISKNHFIYKDLLNKEIFNFNEINNIFFFNFYSFLLRTDPKTTSRLIISFKNKKNKYLTIHSIEELYLISYVLKENFKNIKFQFPREHHELRDKFIEENKDKYFIDGVWRL